MMSDTWEIYIPGTPLARAEKIVTITGKDGRRFSRLGDHQPQHDYKTYVKTLIAQNRPVELFAGPLQLCVNVSILRPKSAPKKQIYPITKPDLTNYIKLAEDCLKGLVIRDDSLVCVQIASKTYGDTPGLRIVVTRLL